MALALCRHRRHMSRTPASQMCCPPGAGAGGGALSSLHCRPAWRYWSGTAQVLPCTLARAGCSQHPVARPRRADRTSLPWRLVAVRSARRSAAQHPALWRFECGAPVVRRPPRPRLLQESTLRHASRALGCPSASGLQLPVTGQQPHVRLTPAGLCQAVLARPSSLRPSD